MLTKRQTLLGGGASLILAIVGAGSLRAKAASGKNTSFPVNHTAAEWKRQLTPSQYFILREEGTERPFSSALNDEKHKGVFVCAACRQPLFSSAAKYNSGTGWPSFWKPLSGAVGISTDYKLGYPRSEVHCARCGGHLGHVFNDGPMPTGKRYCMNGDAMLFVPG